MNYCIICRDKDKSEELKQQLLTKIELNYDDELPDYVIAIGGDGTIIKAVHKYPNSIIFGLHTGHLGFYTNYLLNDINLLIEDINYNKYKIQNYDLLSLNIYCGSNLIKEFAINEVSIISPSKALTMNVLIDGNVFENYQGTGLCISTPSGSTAFNKSLAGAIIDSTLKTIQITEIAGINSNVYKSLSSPLVLSSDRKIKLEFLDGQELFINLDGISYCLTDVTSLEINYDMDKIRMGYHSLEDFIKRINRTFLNNK